MNNMYKKLIESGMDYTDRFGFKYYVGDYIKASNAGLHMKGIVVAKLNVIIGVLTEDGLDKSIY